MHELLQKRWVQNASDDLNIDSDNDTSEFIFGGPVKVTRVFATVTTGVTNAAGTVDVELYRYPVAGSSSNAVLLGTWRLTTTTTRAAGAFCYKDLHIDDTDGETAEDGTLRFEAPNSNITAAATDLDPFIIPPGQSFAMKVVEPGDAGVVIPGVEFVQLPFSGTFIDGTNVFRDTTNEA